MAKRKKSKQERELKEAQQAMLEAVADMADVLTCPVMVASEHADFCDGLVHDAERRVEVSTLARRMHAGSSSLQSQLGAVLDDFIEVVDRFQNEMITLRERFALLEDHEVEHSHLELDDVPLHELMEAMFGPPPPETDEHP